MSRRNAFLIHSVLLRRCASRIHSAFVKLHGTGCASCHTGKVCHQRAEYVLLTCASHYRSQIVSRLIIEGIPHLGHVHKNVLDAPPFSLTIRQLNVDGGKRLGHIVDLGFVFLVKALLLHAGQTGHDRVQRRANRAGILTCTLRHRCDIGTEHLKRNSCCIGKAR